MEIMLIIIGLFAAFYIMLVRPVLQQQRRQRRELSDLTIGDEVVTTSGFLAKVAAIETPEQGSVRITLEIAPGVRVQALPHAILQRLPAPAVGDVPELAPPADNAGFAEN